MIYTKYIIIFNLGNIIFPNDILFKSNDEFSNTFINILNNGSIDGIINVINDNGNIIRLTNGTQNMLYIIPNMFISQKLYKDIGKLDMNDIEDTFNSFCIQFPFDRYFVESNKLNDIINEYRKDISKIYNGLIRRVIDSTNIYKFIDLI